MNHQQTVLALSLLCALSVVSCSRDEATPIEVVAHRGANDIAPENTMAAATACVDLGVDYVEIDVRTSKDGVLYVLRDETVDRTTDGTGPLYMMDSEAIDKLDAGSWFDSRFAGERIPRVRDVLKWAHGKIGVYLDVKAADIEQVVAVVNETGMQRDCFFWFEVPENAVRFRQLAPDLPLKVNVATVDGLKEAVSSLNPQIVETVLSQLTPDFVNICRENGIRIMVREETGDPEAFQAILQSEADMVNLDHADAFVALRDGTR